jgi:hypothetical protein
MLKNLDTALKELALMLQKEVLRRMQSQINVKTGTATLIGSDLEKSVDFTNTNETDIVFSILDYWQYVAYGRRAGAKMPPMDAILGWMKKKGLGQDNSLAWAIRKAIVRDGIKPRPFIGSEYNIDDTEKVLPYLDDLFNQWADDVFNLICNSIKYFN